MILNSPNRRSPPARRGNWGARTLVLLVALLAFVGFWQGARNESAGRGARPGAGAGSTDYAPPVRGKSGLLSPANFPRLPDASTHSS